MDDSSLEKLPLLYVRHIMDARALEQERTSLNIETELQGLRRKSRSSTAIS